MINISKVEKLCSSEQLSQLNGLLKKRILDLDRSIFQEFKNSIELASQYLKNESHLSLNGRHLSIGTAQKNLEIKLKTCIEKMIPWRKGPFIWHGIPLEAEWDSSIKWERMEPFLGPLWGKSILDVGCNNGYYLLRACLQEPKIALGIDPTARFFYQWQLLTHNLHLPNADFQLLGIEHLNFFPERFDLVFCLGILYHHPDPIGQLKLVKQSLKKKGKAIIEVQGIDSQEEIALFPTKRYAKAPGVWFLPSAPCLKNWLHRAGFKTITLIDSTKTTNMEQRNSEFCPRPYETLEDFLSIDDQNKTVEGYPAPFRHMFLAEV